MIDLDSALHANRAIVPLIYEATAGVRPWNDVVREMAGFLDSQMGFIAISYLTSGRGEVVASSGLDPEFHEIWEQNYAVNDWVRLAQAHPPGKVLHAARDVPVAELLETPIGRDLLVPQGLQDGMGVMLTDSPLFVGAISMYSREGLLTQRALDRLEFLTPHLSRALALHQRFSAIEAQARTFSRSLDDLSSGVVFFHKPNSVAHANTMARRMAEEADGFHLRDGRLGFADRSVLPRLEHAVQQAMHPKPGEVGRAFFRVERPSGQRPYHAIVSQAVLGSHGIGAVAGDAGDALALWLNDPEQTFTPCAESLTALLDLTPAEARISAALASGQSLIDYAGVAGITQNTARSTLKHVFAKTGTRSQADLVRLISQSIPSPPF